MADGTIILTWFTSTAFLRWMESGRLPEPWHSQWSARIARQGLTPDTPVSGWLMRSHDGGCTWEAAHEIPVGHHAGPTALSDGRLIYIGSATPDGMAAVWESPDKGDNWTQIGQLHGPVGVDAGTYGLFNENHVLELAPDHLLVMARTEFPDYDQRYLYRATSDDGGYTWTHLEATPMWGHPPHLIRLSAGPILCVYGHRRDPYSIRGALSYDEGQTWDADNTITIYNFDRPCDMGYPVSLEVTTGHIVTVFYCNLKETPRHEQVLAYLQHPGGILYTRWTLQ